MDREVKGKYFATEPDQEGFVRILWSDETTDRAKWDPLDFWIVPAAEVEMSITRLKEGIQ